LLFGVLEPAALIWGFAILFSDPQGYVNMQVPSKIHIPISAGSKTITLQLGNVYLLLAAIAVLCSFTKHGAISRKYLLIVALADLGHVYSSYVGMGDSYFWDVGSWNDMAWGNVGVSAFLCVNRIATVLGLFGKFGTTAKAKKN